MGKDKEKPENDRPQPRPPRDEGFYKEDRGGFNNEREKPGDTRRPSTDRDE